MQITQLTDVAGHELRDAYHVAGDDKPWILLVIPFGLDVRMAAAFFEFFGTHYNVCTLESRLILDPSEREYQVADFSIDNHAADLIAVLDELRVREAILVGYCSGAGIALAAINLAPNRFSELVLAHGEYTLLAEAKCTTQFAADMDTLLGLAASSAERAQLVFDKIQSERFDGGPNRPQGLDQPFSELRILKRYARNYLAYKSEDYLGMARDVSHPTLLMAGGKDVQVNVESCRKLHENMPHAKLFVDPDADHYGVLTSDSATLIAIWNFICENAYARSHRRVHSRGF
ncbi:MAG: alpha/beta hydrolase [Rhodanobacteraceae bacterium]|nr:alpha/beta hydrolase [Rhodanobacteraceae bacterium]